MTTVAFLCNWGNTSQELLTFLARQTPAGRGEWGALRGVAPHRHADVIVVLEDLPAGMRRSDVDLSRTIFLPREPLAVRKRKNYESFGAPLAFTHRDIHQAAVWRIMLGFAELEEMPYVPRRRLLSTVTSAAAQTSGHHSRVAFLREFARRYPDVLDVYGYGWKDELGKAYKGELGNRFAKITDFPALCKLAGLEDYRYALAFENCSQANYFSEKIADCWLAWTMPIYWGCPNLAEFFPEDAFHLIDPSASDCVERVREIVARPVGARQIEAMREARRLVLHRYNIWATIDDIVNGRRPRAAPRPTFLRRIAMALTGGSL